MSPPQTSHFGGDKYLRLESNNGRTVGLGQSQLVLFPCNSLFQQRLLRSYSVPDPVLGVWDTDATK